MIEHSTICTSSRWCRRHICHLAGITRGLGCGITSTMSHMSSSSLGSTCSEAHEHLGRITNALFSRYGHGESGSVETHQYSVTSHKRSLAGGSAQEEGHKERLHARGGIPGVFFSFGRSFFSTVSVPPPSPLLQSRLLLLLLPPISSPSQQTQTQLTPTSS